MDINDQILIKQKAIETNDCEVEEKFEYYVNKRFPKSLRATGRRKWKSAFLAT